MNIPIAGNAVRCLEVDQHRTIVIISADRDMIEIPVDGRNQFISIKVLVKTNSEFSRDGGRTWEKIELD